MKKILFLLLSTIAMYGQVPADATPLENIQITNNTQSTTATKVNVQENDGTINTISKSDLVNVVEVNDVPSLPLVGEVGKIYVVKNVNKIYRWNGTFYQELAGSDISGKEDIANKQNSLTVDGTGVKYVTVDAVNTNVVNKADTEGIRLDNTITPIYAWGDSLTGGAGQVPYPTALRSQTFFSVTNKGYPSESSTQIKDRMLSEPSNYSKSVVIWIGRNNYNAPNIVKADIATMVSALGHTRYLIVGIINGDYATEYAGQAGWLVINQLNADLKALYGKRFVDIRPYLVSLKTNSAQDLIDFANDVPPASLRIDPLHLTSLGYEKVSSFINKSLGILYQNEAYFQSKDFKYYFESNLPLHTFGNETKTGILTFSNSGTTQINGLVLNNTGTTSTANSIYVNNSSSGRGIYTLNTSTGQGHVLDNFSTGQGLFVNNILTGRGISIDNTSTGRGITAQNTSTGRGFSSDNAAGGQGFYSNNTSTGFGIYSANASTGRGISNDNNSTGFGYYSNNASTGIGMFLNSQTASTGDILQFAKNGTVTSKFDQNGILTSPSPILTGIPVAPTATAGTNTTQIATTAFVAGGLATKENAFSKNTAFNKNFGTTVGTVVEGGTLGSNAYSSTAYLPINDGARVNLDYNTKLTSGFYNSLDSNVNNPLGQAYSQLIVAKGVDTGLQIAGGFNTDNLHFRGWSSSGSNFTPWRKVWHDGNDGVFPKLANVNLFTNKMRVSGGGVSTSISDVNTTATHIVDVANTIISLATGYVGSDNVFLQSFNNSSNTPKPLILNPFGGDVVLGGNLSALNYTGDATLTGTPTAPTATAGTNTTQIATTAFVAGGLATKENAFSKNTAFNKNFGTTVGTVVEGGTLGSNAYNSTAYLPLTGGTLTGGLTIPYAIFDNGIRAYSIESIGSSVALTDVTGGAVRWKLNSSGVFNINNLSGTGTRPIGATSSGDLVPMGVGYKVYTALIKQTATNAPVATVLENTLGGTIVWARSETGVYIGTLIGAFPLGKTFVSCSSQYFGYTVMVRLSADTVSVLTRSPSNTPTDSFLDHNAIEIRVYN